VTDWQILLRIAIWSTTHRILQVRQLPSVCTFRSTATGHQKPPAAALASSNSCGNLIATGYTSYLQELE